ncbi:hypothetical protein BGZ67_006836 [Mortierella alpina]|nr:hypothetical protein BGZ67_006836 [Mortierella alpina]
MEQAHSPNHHSAATSPQKASPSRLVPQGRPLSPSALQQHKRSCTVTFKENTESPVLSKPRRPSTPIPSRPTDPDYSRDKDAEKAVRRSSNTQDTPQQLRPAGDTARLPPFTPTQTPRTIKLATPSAIAESFMVPELKTRRVVSDEQSDRVDDDDIVGDDPQFIPSNDTTECDEEIVDSSEDSSSPIEDLSSGTSEERFDESRSLKTPAAGARHPHQLKTPLTTPLPCIAKKASEPQAKSPSRVQLTLTSEMCPRRHPIARRYLGHRRANYTRTIESMTPASHSRTPSSTLDSTPSQESVLIRNRRPGGYNRTVVEKGNCDATDGLAQDVTNELEKLDTPAAQGASSQHLLMSQTPSLKVGATPHNPPPRYA